ncbi:tannase/feruloyl esterase family alpha/beta hydrolase [Novosphingobium sp. PS1R-30]|uniref:Tannase/feruloyl esterase family alpha/beta hydrolase n=1 Tax=Novosphingobium anseongense TaxID=3133436 RepID=A0ABU8S1G2_9SPHN
MQAHRRKILLGAVAAVSAVAAVTAVGAASRKDPAGPPPSADFAATCTPEAMTAVVAGLGAGIEVKQVPNGPQLPRGTKLVPAAGRVPAYCQVTGSYVTNPKTGKKAHFLATFPERWNGKYLQLGCSGSCGYLLMNDPAAPPITITAQGYPGQLIEKGYATFGNDLGHVAASPVAMGSDWLKAADGSLDVDALEDYLFRADFVMADMGKAYTRAFYGRVNGAGARITRSYFSGCSQGGREALIAATRFPEKFDGIIAGSPVVNQSGILWHGMARALFARDTAPAKLTPGQIGLLKSRVLDVCDGLDGVKDGLIQNPAACQIHPRDVPICRPGEAGDTCLSKAQADSVSLYFAGVTDPAGNLVQPGMPMSDQGYGFVAPVPAGMPIDADMRFLVGKAFDGIPLATAREGGPGQIDALHAVVDAAAYRKYLGVLRRGTVMPEDFAKLLKSKARLLWYHNLSDEILTPFMSINAYKELAERHGGYASLRTRIRFFGVPGTGHCGMGGDGPSNFDAASALEDWVEKGAAPNALLARQLDPAFNNLLMGKVDWSRPALRTMPLCAFPQMAAYKGTGDIKRAENWECRASDTRMLQLGASGLQSGVRR